MMRALSIFLVLGMVEGIQVQTQKTWADAAAVATEVKHLCDTGDIDGAHDVLQAHGKPIGAQHGKEILKTCFMDNGECLLGKAKCAWMKKCLSSEGECEQVPVAEAFLEIPGGKAVFKEMQAETKSDHSALMSKLVEAAKKLRPSGLLQKNQPPPTGQFTLSPKLLAPAPGDKSTGLQKLKNSLSFMKGARELWFDYLPQKSQKQFIMELMAFNLFMRASCGTTYKQKFDPVTNKPLYGFYQPLGAKGPQYSAPLYDVTVSQSHDLSDWICTYPPHLEKWQERQIAEARAQHLMDMRRELKRPERKIFEKKHEYENDREQDAEWDSSSDDK